MPYIPVAVVNQTAGSGTTELSYVEFTANITVTSTSEAAPDDIISAAAVVFDGATRVCIEFFSPNIRSSTSSSEIVIDLWESTNELGHIANLSWDATGNSATVLARRFLTPTAGSKTYKIRAWKVGGNDTVIAGVGGSSGVYVPGYIRITTA